MKKYNYNENYFESIDSEKKAYILGFFYADGYNSDRQISFTQSDEDIDVLEKIRLEIGTENPIVKVIRPINNKLMDTLTYSSKKMCNDLTKLGAFRNKSLTLKFPDFLDYKLMNHFIRGYFDGDGCVWNGKRKKMTVKDNTRESGFRERIVHNVKFTFTGNYDFINSLQDYLVLIGVVSKKTKLNFSKAKNKNNNTSENVCTMEYSGRKQLKNLYNFMYSEATIYMDRKKLKFEEIFCASGEKSSEDTSLIAGIPETAISSEVFNVEERSSTIPEMGVESSDSKCEAPNSKEKGEDIVSSAIK